MLKKYDVFKAQNYSEIRLSMHGLLVNISNNNETDEILSLSKKAPR